MNDDPATLNPAEAVIRALGVLVSYNLMFWGLYELTNVIFIVDASNPLGAISVLCMLLKNEAPIVVYVFSSHGLSLSTNFKF